jgi:mono/diheme cytochrome c family protein
MPMRLFPKIFVAQILVLLMSHFVSAADERVDYQKQIKPVLVERCVACHGALQQEAGLRLDTATFAIKGGESGPAIKPGDIEGSLLLKRVSASVESERMPPEGLPLKPEQIAAIRTWISQKAEAPSNEQPERHPRDHWAFQTPARPTVPRLELTAAEKANAAVCHDIMEFCARVLATPHGVAVICQFLNDDNALRQ